MVMTLQERWLEEGRAVGIKEGEAAVPLRLLGRRFGPVSPELEQRVRQADREVLLSWVDRVWEAESLDELLRSA